VLTMEQTARAVGLSPRQLRRRIEATGPLLAPHVRRGEKNRLLLAPGAVEILRAVEDRRSQGATLEEARDWVAVSMRGEEGSGQGRGRERTGGAVSGESGETAILRELVEEKERTIRRLEEDNARLQARVDQLIPLALPRPRRGILRLFRVGSA
jgi:hypothetical protein